MPFIEINGATPRYDRQMLELIAETMRRFRESAGT
jgi:hypothetical protein